LSENRTVASLSFFPSGEERKRETAFAFHRKNSKSSGGLRRGFMRNLSLNPPVIRKNVERDCGSKERVRAGREKRRGFLGEGGGEEKKKKGEREKRKEKKKKKKIAYTAQ